MRGLVLTTASLILSTIVLGCCGMIPGGCCDKDNDSDRGRIALLSEQDNIKADLLRQQWNECQEFYHDSTFAPDTLSVPIGDFRIIFSKAGFVADTIEVTIQVRTMLILRATLVKADSASLTGAHD